MKQPIYLDYAAATPVDERVMAAMRPYFLDKFYNPSANYLAAKSITDTLEAARSSIASQLGAKPSEIIFTAGATEANNTAIHGVMRQFPDANVVVGSIEHESVLAPASEYDYRQAPAKPDGRINLDRLRGVIDARTALVAVMYANNEIGTIQPIKEVVKLVEAERINRKKSRNSLPIYLLTDAAQAANYLDLHTSRLGVDLMSLNGGKIYGPKQSGCLFIKTGVQLEPLISGGRQEGGLRSGTENIVGSIGLAKSLEIAQQSQKEERARLAALQAYFFQELAQLIPGSIINGSIKHRLPNNLHFTIPGQDNERLIFALDAAGIMVAAGSACSASDDTSSHVLLAIGLDDTRARSSFRLTMGRDTTKAKLDKCLKALAGLIA